MKAEAIPMEIKYEEEKVVLQELLVVLVDTTRGDSNNYQYNKRQKQWQIDTMVCSLCSCCCC